MSIEYEYGRRRINLENNNYLLIVSKGEENQILEEVIFKSSKEEIKLGSYFTNSGGCRGYVDFNSEYVIILSIDNYTNTTIVISIFDVFSRQKIEGTQEELLEFYANLKKGITKKLEKTKNK